MIDPNNTWYMAFLAEIYVGNNKLQEAVGLFKNLHEVEPLKRSHLNNIAIVELMMGDTLSALDSYEEYVERFGLDDEVYGPYIEVLKAKRAWADMEDLSRDVLSSAAEARNPFRTIWRHLYIKVKTMLWRRG